MTQENAADTPMEKSTLHSGPRYWGTVEVIEEGKNYRINRIVIKPKHSMKPQVHYHRSEHWVVVSGVAKVSCGEEEKLLHHNQSTYVPQATLHSVENPGTIPLVLLEIQNGEYLGEEDTERPYDLKLTS